MRPVDVTTQALPADETLVSRAISGDRWAEEALYLRHAPAIAGIVGRLLGDREETRDVMQDTFIEVLGSLHGLKEPSRFRSWAIGIAVHQVHRRFRKRALLRRLGLHSPGESNLEALAHDSVGPERMAELYLLDGALSRLGTDERIAWTLRVVEGMSLADIAIYMKCSLATAKRKITKGTELIARHTGLDLAAVCGGGADE